MHPTVIVNGYPDSKRQDPFQPYFVYMYVHAKLLTALMCTFTCVYLITLNCDGCCVNSNTFSFSQL